MTRNDIGAEDGIADPFLVTDGSQFYLFYEEIESSDENIGYATSPDGLTWTPQGTIIDIADHMAYPYVFKWDGSWYMSPDRAGSGPGDFEIWKADSFPESWSTVETAISENYTISDPTPFYFGGRWYCIVYDGTNIQKRLYYADEGRSIEGRSWTEHPSSPIATGSTLSRNAGRPIVHDGYIDWPSQNDDAKTVRLHRITDLTPSSFSWSEVATSPILQPTDVDWNANDMHHVDMMMPYVGGPPLVAVDGNDGRYKLGMYTMGESDIAARMNSTTGVSVSDTNYTVIPFDTVEHDYGQGVDLANDNWTAPENGVYQFNAQVRFGNFTETDFRVLGYISVDASSSGDDVIAAGLDHAAVGDSLSVEMTGQAKLRKGVSIGCVVWQNSGATIDTLAGGRSDTYFDVSKIGSL